MPNLAKVRPRTVLICFDGSAQSGAAILKAAEILGRRQAVVLTVCEPIRAWEPQDPITVLSAPIERRIVEDTGLEQVATNVAYDTAVRGQALARSAGFEASTRVAHG